MKRRRQSFLALFNYIPRLPTQKTVGERSYSPYLDTATSEKAAGNPPIFSPMTSKIFMIVDDDPDDRDFFTDAVNMIFSTSQCLVAVNGEDALRKLQNETTPRPDYIFLDLNVPRIDGRSCLSAMKRDYHLKDIPVIMFSTTSDPGEIEETLKLGAVHFVVKPFKLGTLCDEILTVTEKF